MNLYKAPVGGHKYYRFKVKGNKQLHTGPVGEPSKCNRRNMMKALKYNKKKLDEFLKTEVALVMLLPSLIELNI